MRKERLEAAAKYYAAYNAGSVDAVIDCYSDDATHEEVAFAKTRCGREALREGVERFLALFADLEFELRRTVVSGDSIMCDYRMTGTVTKDLGPMKLAGESIVLSGSHLLEFDGIRISKCRDYWDPEELASQAVG
ncbi:nuclear transport factor 2 family protein [Pseudoruegeria sp. HB172150]|uniref:nuclear transport factor 2 family protein n=1 Tax=Pseudoruegeria sp. HB172150 TaxID=2721164 RepID=UPI001551A21F|nr:nuclear transport factor 2 family protein [Pseudoruegeria sp. HB172150]